MKKYILDLVVTENVRLHNLYVLLKLTTQGGDPLPEMMPGQFVEIKVEQSPSTFLRRPISINYIDRAKNELWLLVQLVGDGTRAMAQYVAGDIVNIMLPLGNTFTLPASKETQPMLIGGGVGTAPMLYLGSYLKAQGYTPQFLLGARSASDVLQLEQFEAIGNTYITTEDGSLGEKGYVTQHSILNEANIGQIYSCGPKPMMMAVAAYAKANNIACEVSLENTMACGIGACLCCVEQTNEGHKCVCTDGPIFNITELTWQI